MYDERTIKLPALIPPTGPHRNQDSKMNPSPLHSRDIPFDSDLVLRTIIRELVGVLEDVIGYKETEGYIALIGQDIGDWFNETYKREWGVSTLSPEQLVDVLIDLKRRLHGNFSLLQRDTEKIVLVNNRCPFKDKVLDCLPMCMMTCNVFGVITAENLGYAKVVLEETLAARDNQCKVTIFLQNTPAAERAEGKEFFIAKCDNAG